MEHAPPTFHTSNVSIAATMGALGFPWIDPNTPCTNYYGKGEKIPRGKDGKPVHPGTVTFFLNKHSETFPIGHSEVLKEWEDGGSDVALDEKLAPQEGDSAEISKLKIELLDILPLALVSYIKGALRNRKNVAGAFRVVPSMIGYKDGKGAVLIPAENNERARRELNL